jgi:hypothetical protein
LEENTIKNLRINFPKKFIIKNKDRIIVNNRFKICLELSLQDENENPLEAIKIKKSAMN